MDWAIFLGNISHQKAQNPALHDTKLQRTMLAAAHNPKQRKIDWEMIFSQIRYQKDQNRNTEARDTPRKAKNQTLKAQKALNPTKLESIWKSAMLTMLAASCCSGRGRPRPPSGTRRSLGRCPRLRRGRWRSWRRWRIREERFREERFREEKVEQEQRGRRPLQVTRFSFVRRRVLLLLRRSLSSWKRKKFALGFFNSLFLRALNLKKFKTIKFRQKD